MKFKTKAAAEAELKRLGFEKDISQGPGNEFWEGNGYAEIYPYKGSSGFYIKFLSEQGVDRQVNKILKEMGL